MTNQHKKQDPRSQFPKVSPPSQHQAEPGLDSQLEPKADHGDDSYVGSGKLKGRRALITGGDSGIGRATAIAFAREGADVAINYLADEEPDAKVVKRLIEEAGQKAVLLPGDLADEEFCRKLVSDAARALGGLDIVVNNAGKQVYIEEFEELSRHQMEATFAVNVFAMFTICQEALKYLGPGATIINTTSIQADQPSPGLLDYASTKGAISNFTKGLAQQLTPKSIRVNAVAPGPIWTPLQPSDGQPQAKMKKFGQNTPLGRAGHPAELAPVYVFLAGQESSYISGEVIAVTGGRLL